MKYLLSILCLFVLSCDSGGDDFVEVEGCTNANACNFNADATVEDNSCIDTDCGGGCNENVELWDVCYNIEETTSLDLSYSGFTGEIPSEIGQLTDLEHLKLNGNQLTGEIPSEIGQLTDLEYLYLNDNQLTGEIPPEIGNLTNLNYWFVYQNQLTGEIPSEIGNLINIAILWLGYNELSGDIPIEVCNLIENNNLDIGDILNGNNLTNTCD